MSNDFVSEKKTKYEKEARASSNEDGNFCFQCEEIFPDFLSTLNHKCLPHKCKTCLRVFEYDFQLCMHKCNETEVCKMGTYTCNFCNTTFISSSLLTRHEISCTMKNKQSRQNLCNGYLQVENGISLNESNDDVSSDDINEQTMSSKRKFNGSFLIDSKKRKRDNSLDSPLGTNPKIKHSNNINNSILLSTLQAKEKLHVSGKFKNSRKFKTKLNYEIVQACDNNVKPKPKKFYKVKKKVEDFQTDTPEADNKSASSKNSEKERNSQCHYPLSKEKPVQKKRSSKVKKKVEDFQTDTLEAGNAAAGSKNSEKEQHSQFHYPSSKEKPVQKKRSNSRDCDRGIDACETSSTSSYASVKAHSRNLQEIKKKITVDDKKETKKVSNSVMSRKTSTNKNKVSPGLLSESSASVPVLQPQKQKKIDKRKKSLTIEKNSILNKNPRHIPLELEISESTLNYPPDDKSAIEDFVTDKKRCNVKSTKSLPREFRAKKGVDLEKVFESLPTKSGILLKTSPGSFHTYKCPACNKLFKHVRSGSIHIDSCKKSLWKNISAQLNEIIYVCTACHYYSSRKYDLNNHKAFCSPNSVCDILFNETSKPFVCPRCSYSCLSSNNYDTHSCRDRLQRMQACIVKLEKNNLGSDMKGITLNTIECEVPDESPFRQEAAKARFYTGLGKACVRKKIKDVIKNAEIYNTVDDVVKNIVEPVLEVNNSMNSENLSPDYNLDLIMPYENQKLLAEAAKELLFNESSKDSDIFNVNLLDNTVASNYLNDDLQNAVAFDDLNDDLVSDPQFLELLKAHKCKCKNKIANSDEEQRPNSDDEEQKPCITCLDAFMKKYVLIEDPNLQMKDSVSVSSTSTSPQANESILRPSTSSQANDNTLHPSTSSQTNDSMLYPNTSSQANNMLGPNTSSQANDSSIQEETNYHATSFSDPSSFHISNIVSFNNTNINSPIDTSEISTNLSNDTVCTLENHNAPQISSDIEPLLNLTNCTLDNLTFTAAEMPSKTISSAVEIYKNVSTSANDNHPTEISPDENTKHNNSSNNFKPVASSSLELDETFVSSDILTESSGDTIVSEGIPGGLFPISNEENINLEVLGSNEINSSYDFDNNTGSLQVDDTQSVSNISLPGPSNSQENYVDTDGQATVSVAELEIAVSANEEGMDSKSEQNAPSPNALCVQKDNVKIVFSATGHQATISSGEFKVAVTSNKIRVDSKSEQYQNLLFSLLPKLQVITSTVENIDDIFNETMSIICNHELDVDIEQESTHWYFHYVFQSSELYSAYVIRATEQYICATCWKKLSLPSNLIKHIVQEHKINNIYINVY